MTLTTGTTVNIGPKGSSNRAHRITNIETTRATAQGDRKVTLVCISDGTTWTTTIKPTAKRVTWNARLVRAPFTDAERAQSIRDYWQENDHTTKKDNMNLTKRFARGATHAPNGHGTMPLCMPYGGSSKTRGPGAWDETDADVDCKNCQQFTTDETAQDSDTITVSDLADEYDITIQDVTRALDDDTLTEHDGVDAGMARDILNRQRIQIGQIWTSNAHGTDHQVTDYAGNGLWEITGPVGNTYVTSAYDLRSRNTLDMTRFNHPTN